MSLEHPSKINEHLQKLEDGADVKAAVYKFATDVLPETLLLHGMDGTELRGLTQAIEDGLVAAKTTDIGELQAVAAQAINVYLAERSIDKPTFARDFLEKVKMEMAQ